MISSRRLAQMARKWLRAAAAGRKRIAFRTKGAATTAPLDSSDACSTSAPARKGHFVVYSSDGQRFEVPLEFLRSDVFGELLRLSEEVFGLPGDGPITLPWDAAFVDSVVSCLRRRSQPADAESAALLVSMAARSCSATLAPCLLVLNQARAICSC